ncbi:MAG: hypothetical protein QXX01_03090 [Candidatus Aenigmatarchaeota archaeon]
MIDLQRLQEAIYKYEYLIKDEKTVYNGQFAEHVFEDVLGSKENEINEYKQNYCRKDSKIFDLRLTRKELRKDFIYILQILPFESKIHYYKYDLQGILKYLRENKLKLIGKEKYYELPMTINKNTYKYTRFTNNFLLEYFDDLHYNNSTYEEIPHINIENIQKNLLRQENPNFEEYPYGTKGKDIKIYNIDVELKSTKSIHKINNDYFALSFEGTNRTKAKYFIFSYIFEDNSDMINIIMKNYYFEASHIQIYVSKEFVDIVNNNALTDKEKIEKIKSIPIHFKDIKLKFYTTKGLFAFFSNLSTLAKINGWSY